MKKTILVLVAFLAVLSVIGLVTGDEGLVTVLAVGPLAGILLSLVTLIPAVRKRAQSNHSGRIVTLLAVMILSVVFMFSVIRWLEVQVYYVLMSIPYMGSVEDYDSIRGFYAKYDEKGRAIDRETWIRVMIPPLLRWQCYTTEKNVCEFVDQYPDVRVLMTWNRYLLVLAFALGFSLPGGALAWHFTRRKHPPEIVSEG